MLSWLERVFLFALEPFLLHLGIDLGTANTLIYVRGHGIQLREPSVVATNDYGEVLAVGDDAKFMIGKTPQRIYVMRPLQDGVIADYERTDAMLSHFIRKIKRLNSSFYSRIGRVVVGIPSGVTKVERRAVENAVIRTGAIAVRLIEEPKAAALGAGLPIEQPSGNMIVDIGGGTTEVAVLSLGQIITSTSIKVAGDALDKAIIEYARKRYNLQIGERTAERIKIEIGSAYTESEVETTEMRGMDLVTGLPKTAEITTREVHEAMKEKLDQILKAVRDTLEATPPELAADIIDNGIVLCGGGALLRDLPIVIEKDTGIPCRVAENPLECVVRGCQKILDEWCEHPEKYREVGYGAF